MRDIKRIDPILEKLNKFWKQHPELRLSQVLCMIYNFEDGFYIEDSVVENSLDSLLDSLSDDTEWERAGTD